MRCACSGTTLSRGKERTQQRVVQHLVEASPHPSSACALVELCHRVGKGGQQQAARRGEYRGRVSCNAGRSRARAVRKASRRVNSTEHDGREIAHIMYRRQRDRSLTEYQCGENNGVGGSGRTELDRVEAPRGEEIPRHSPGAPKNTTRDAAREFCRATPP